MTPAFAIKRYTRQHHRQTTFPYHQYNGTMGDWAVALFGFSVAKHLFRNGPSFCYGGYFGASRVQIHRHSLFVYETLKRQQIHSDEEVDHFIERIWSSLFRSERIDCGASANYASGRREYNVSEMEREWKELLGRQNYTSRHHRPRQPAEIPVKILAFVYFIILMWFAFVIALVRVATRILK
jgi:hypothetical protein